MKNRKKKLKILLYFIIFGSFLLVILIFVFALNGKNFDNKKEIAEKILKNTDIELKNIHHIANKNGREEWTLKADSVKLDSKKESAELKNISALFFLKDKSEILLFAKNGLLHYSSNNMEAYNDVIIKKEDMILKTDKINYEDKKKELYTDCDISITGKDFLLKAGVMNFNVENEYIEFKSGVDLYINEAFFK